MFMMDLRLASLNGRGLRSDSRRSHLFLYLQRRGIDICCLQETRFETSTSMKIFCRRTICPFQHVLMVVPEVSPG